MVQVGTGSSGTKYIKTKWPHESGLIAGTTKQEGRKPLLEPEDSSLLTKREKEGL
jgi:hypothetical protein